MATIDPEGLVTEAKLQRHDADTAAHTALATTIDDTLVPTSDTNTIRNLVSNLANRIKAATGAGGWKEAPAATLASLSTMIANLATGADVTWDGKKFTNHRLGITGLMDQNGYICFGPNCGSLIIQWGIMQLKNGKGTISLPISAEILFCVLQHYGISPQYYGCNGKAVVGSLKDDDTAAWTALCK